MIGRRALSAVGLVAAVGVGHLATTHLDIDEGEIGPFVRAVDLDGVAHLSYADVEVTDVRPARYVAGSISTDYAKRAGGVFVLVSVKATSTRESTTFRWHYLVDRTGRLYETSSRADCASGAESKTGVAVYALYCFDVPASRLAGLRFQIARGDPTFSDDQGDDLAEVNLAVSRSDAEEWASTDAVYEPVTSEWEPFELQSVELTEDDGS